MVLQKTDKRLNGKGREKFIRLDSKGLAFKRKRKKTIQ